MIHSCQYILNSFSKVSTDEHFMAKKLGSLMCAGLSRDMHYALAREAYAACSSPVI